MAPGEQAAAPSAAWERGLPRRPPCPLTAGAHRPMPCTLCCAAAWRTCTASCTMGCSTHRARGWSGQVGWGGGWQPWAGGEASPGPQKQAACEMRRTACPSWPLRDAPGFFCLVKFYSQAPPLAAAFTSAPSCRWPMPSATPPTAGRAARWGAACAACWCAASSGTPSSPRTTVIWWAWPLPARLPLACGVLPGQRGAQRRGGAGVHGKDAHSCCRQHWTLPGGEGSAALSSAQLHWLADYN